MIKWLKNVKANLLQWINVFPWRLVSPSSMNSRAPGSTSNKFVGVWVGGRGALLLFTIAWLLAVTVGTSLICTRRNKILWWAKTLTSSRLRSFVISRLSNSDLEPAMESEPTKRWPSMRNIPMRESVREGWRGRKGVLQEVWLMVSLWRKKKIMKERRRKVQRHFFVWEAVRHFNQSMVWLKKTEC